MAFHALPAPVLCLLLIVDRELVLLAVFYGGTSGNPTEPRDPEERKKLGFVQVTAKAGDCIIMPLRMCEFSCLDAQLHTLESHESVYLEPCQPADLIGGCGLRAGHAVQPWLPTDRDRVVLFFTFIPQFCAHPDPDQCSRRQDGRIPESSANVQRVLMA